MSIRPHKSPTDFAVPVARRWGPAIVAFVATILASVSSNAAIIINTFKDLTSDYASTRFVGMDSVQVGPTSYGNYIYDNLMIQNGGAVEPVGLDFSYWFMGFLDLDPEGWAVVGWAHNRWVHFPGFGATGWMSGEYTDQLSMDEDQTPDLVWLVHDVDGDGVIGTLEAGTFHVDPGDEFFTSADILFGPSQILGDVSQLPAYNDYTPSFRHLALPSMTVVPEPGPSALLALGAFMALKRR